MTRGQRYKDGFVKLVVLECADATVMFGFVGVGVMDGKTIDEWLVSLLDDNRLYEQPLKEVLLIIGRLAGRAIAKLSWPDMRSTFSAAGLHDGKHVLCLVSNFESFAGRLPTITKDFSVHMRHMTIERSDAVAIKYCGAVEALPVGLKPTLLRLRRRKYFIRRSGPHLAQLLAQIIRMSSGAKEPASLISPCCTTAVMDLATMQVHTKYHEPGKTRREVLPHVVNPRMTIKSLTLNRDPGRHFDVTASLKIRDPDLTQNDVINMMATWLGIKEAIALES